MGKIIITGPGRAGSTFLVQLLTRLGFDTGFRAGEEGYSGKWRAGAEWHLVVDFEDLDANRGFLEAGPRVLKSPEWGMQLKFLMRERLIEVDHVVVPFRDLDLAAESRLSVGLDWMIDPSIPSNKRIEEQGNIHALCLGRTIEACILYEIPCTIMRFPLLVQDEDYCYQKLNAIEAIDRAKFGEIFRQLANPDQIVFMTRKDE